MLKSRSFGKVFKKTIASTLAMIISISVFTVTDPLKFSVNASADAFSNTKVYVSDFSSDDSSTWKLSDSTAKIADGKLSLTAATANSYSSAAVRTEERKSQYVRAVFNTSDFSNSRPVVWARATLLETGNPESLVGYYLAFEGTSPALYKREKSGDTYKDTVLAYCGAITWDSNKEYTLEIDVTGTADAAVITARIYKSTSLALQGIQTYVDVTNPYTKGSAAVSLKATAANATGKFDKLEYYTTDNVSEIYYAQENGIKTGVSFAQHTALLRDTQYTLSVEVAEAEVYEPLVISYATTATNVGEHILINPKDCVITKKNGKNVYSYTFKLADQTIAPLYKYDYRYSANSLRTTPVFIGFRQSDANIKGNKYTNFQLREIKADGTFGPNILVNGDFKLGLYGWSDDVNVNFNSSTGYSLWSDTASKNSSRIILDGPIIQTDMDNTYYKLTNDKELNITFMGGSVTSGHGASDVEKTSWRALTTQWFKDNFDATISAKNAAVGSTGSHMAVYNYSLVTEHKTDLLFIDSAINDFYLYNNQIDGNANPESADAYNNTLRNVESLIRNARRANPNIDIVLVLTFDHWRLSDASNPSLQAMIDLSKKYQLPCVDLREPLKARATADGLAWGSDGLKPYRTEDDTDNIEQLYLKGDGVHPIDAGYKIFGDYITEMLDGYMTNAETNNVSELKDYELTDEPMSASIIDNPMVIPANKIALSDGWTHDTSKNFSTISGKFGTTYTSGVVTTETAGSKLTYKFTGTEFGIFVMTGPNYGQLYIEVDGVPYKQGENGNFADGIIELYRGNNDHRTQVIASGLSNTEHTVTIESRAGKNGNKVEIGAYFVNGEAERDYRVTTTTALTSDPIDSSNNLLYGKVTEEYGQNVLDLTDGISGQRALSTVEKLSFDLGIPARIEEVIVRSQNGNNETSSRIGKYEIYAADSLEELYNSENKIAVVDPETPGTNWLIYIDKVVFAESYAKTAKYIGFNILEKNLSADKKYAYLNEIQVKGTQCNTVTVTTGNGGTATPIGQTIFETGKTVAITVTPDKGYKVDKVLVNGVVSQLTDGVYTFDGTAGQHTFDVTFTMIGDANNDGSLDDADLEVIKKHILGLKNADIKYADTDSDGDVDVLDLVLANELQ